ncbi:MAG TPA: hypothetical protein PKL28_08750 [Rhodocyclaceae bacterium]|nr:hypothetical protein [Rhodocyclaceae bacterium]HMW77781.1 hypothetical protein [Rhodocyclaceae bacterium]HNM21716.1 hypothetical protein [Rhodocyclaceae bacterium]HNM81132.1 hypothetical protein [Rhodocyclaceae bacterium]HNP05280.1 hypothetical protein [Rhodocyclaceae bacterium]
MNGYFLTPVVAWLSRNPNVLLAAHLLILHVIAFWGPQEVAVRLLWPVAVGLLLLWQPFVAGERRIGAVYGAVLLALVAATTVFLSPWLLLIWCGALAAVIGGRVLWTGKRLERVGFLYTFGFLLGLAILGIVPDIAPGALSLEPLSRDTLGRLYPLLLLVVPFFPARPARRRAGDAFDFLYGVLVFLLLSVFVLGSMAYMLVGRVSYLEAVFQASLSLAGALLILAWVWNPRAGFSGIGSAFARYVLSIGMPLEQWLVHIQEESEKQSDPEQFLHAVMARLLQLPWVCGARWNAEGMTGDVGISSAYFHEFARGHALKLTLYFRQPLPPAVGWHVDWLLRLAAEFYLVKRQTRELNRVAYQQAVYETGARVTHDVKNLLQSLHTLCYAATQPGEPTAVADLLGRQLPQIADRLKATLEKLQRPPRLADDLVDARVWWDGLRQRYSGTPVTWINGYWHEGALVPKGLFDSVAENLLQNALAKGRREDGLEIVAELGPGNRGWTLRICDSGSPLPEALALRLLREPVPSEDGLGIGLYHAARQAEELGYQLALDENSPGRVCFSLSARP